MKWMEHLAHMAEGKGVYNVLEGNPDRNNPPGIPRFIWVENIKENLKEVRVKTATDWLRIGRGVRHF